MLRERSSIKMELSMSKSLNLEYIQTTQIRLNPRNARTHGRRQIQQIRASIQSFGFTNPVLVDEAGFLIAGHGRLEAANGLGIEEVPAIRILHLSDPEKRALALADNKIALNAGWDLEILASELADLSSMELNFDIQDTGFEVAEIDLILDHGVERTPEPELAPMPGVDAPIVTKRGDLWLLNKHRVLCGDALSPSDMELLMDGKLADVGFIDPPFNVQISGHVSGKGRTKHREFAQAAGEMSEAEFTGFLTRALSQGAGHSRDGAVWFCCMDWRHVTETAEAGRNSFDQFLNLCIWVKTNGGMGSLYRSQHELIFVFRKGKKSHRNNVQLGRFGRNRTNVWTYPGVNAFREGRMQELTAHPTAKPVAMIRDALLDVSAGGQIVLDSFLGAGAKLIAAEQSGRAAYGLEIDPAYVDTALRRWRRETGVEPVRACDGRTLSDLEFCVVEGAAP